MKDIKAGDIIKEEDLRVIRPGYGIKPKYVDKVVGTVASRDILRGMPISEADCKG